MQEIPLEVSKMSVQVKPSSAGIKVVAEQRFVFFLLRFRGRVQTSQKGGKLMALSAKEGRSVVAHVGTWVR